MSPHAPVLLNEVIEALEPRDGDVIIDATFGAGGYTRAILDAGARLQRLDHFFQQDRRVRAHAPSPPGRRPASSALRPASPRSRTA